MSTENKLLTEKRVKVRPKLVLSQAVLDYFKERADEECRYLGFVISKTLEEYYALQKSESVSQKRITQISGDFRTGRSQTVSGRLQARGTGYVEDGPLDN